MVEVLRNLSEAKERVLGMMRFNGLMNLPKDESDYERPFKLRFAFWLLMKKNKMTTTKKVLGQIRSTRVL